MRISCYFRLHQCSDVFVGGTFSTQQCDTIYSVSGLGISNDRIRDRLVCYIQMPIEIHVKTLQIPFYEQIYNVWNNSRLNPNSKW